MAHPIWDTCDAAHTLRSSLARRPSPRFLQARPSPFNGTMGGRPRRLKRTLVKDTVQGVRERDGDPSHQLIMPNSLPNLL